MKNDHSTNVPLMLTHPSEKEYDALIRVWERSIKATHHFLKESDIRFYKPFVAEFLTRLQIYVVYEKNRIAAFMALSEEIIEMLFVDPAKRSNGYGSMLIDIAIYEKGIRKVAVNEDNKNALKFYVSKGFIVKGREETDAFGKPYPILNLQLERAAAIVTERLLLRPFRIDDLQEFHRICSDPEIGKSGGWKPHKSIEESNAILQNFFVNKKTVWAIERKSDKLLIGAIGLTIDAKRQNTDAKSIGYWLGKQYWGNGYMTEAAKAVIAHCRKNKLAKLITASCFNNNTRSYRLLKSAGFKEEGTLHYACSDENGVTKDELLFYLPYPSI